MRQVVLHSFVASWQSASDHEGMNTLWALSGEDLCDFVLFVVL